MDKESIREFGMSMLTFLGVVIFTMLVVLIPVYYSSCHQAEVLNNEYGTEYTCSEMLWAGDTIQKVIEGQRYRIEITNELGGTNNEVLSKLRRVI